MEIRRLGGIAAWPDLIKSPPFPLFNVPPQKVRVLRDKGERLKLNRFHGGWGREPQYFKVIKRKTMAQWIKAAAQEYIQPGLQFPF